MFELPVFYVWYGKLQILHLILVRYWTLLISENKFIYAKNKTTSPSNHGNATKVAKENPRNCKQILAGYCETNLYRIERKIAHHIHPEG